MGIIKLNLVALFDDDTRAQIREAVLGEARGIARSVLDKTVIEEMRRLVDLYITHSFGGAREKFQEALKTVFRELLSEAFEKDEIGALIRSTARDSVQDALTTEMRLTISDYVSDALRKRFSDR